MSQHTLSDRRLQLNPHSPCQSPSTKAWVMLSAQPVACRNVQDQRTTMLTETLVEFVQFDLQQRFQPLGFDALENQDAINTV